MANQKHLKILKQGVEVWNEWRDAHENIWVDLMHTNLSNIDLAGAKLWNVYFWGTDLSNANLSNANLGFANLSWANLTNAILTEADLSRSLLYGTNFSFANLTKADLLGVNLTKANLNGANLREANLSTAVLVQTNLRRAILTSCRVYGTASWDVDVTEAEQSNLVITESDSDKPIITVDDLEVAQFVYLLLNHKKLRNIFNSVTDRGVLILGRFGGGGLEVLQAIAAKLREANYLPIIFDFDRPQDRNYTETVKTLAGLSRFIIVDLSGPSVPQELYATVPHFKIPFVPIIEAGRKPFAMAVDILEYPWVVRPPVTFATTEELLEQLPAKVIAPAEEKHRARQKLLDELFNKT